MINVDVFSEEKNWSTKLKKKEVFIYKFISNEKSKSFNTVNKIIIKLLKNNFTRVLKGHIAVFLCNINKKFNGHLIDQLARKSLKKAGFM